MRKRQVAPCCSPQSKTNSLDSKSCTKHVCQYEQASLSFPKYPTLSAILECSSQPTMVSIAFFRNQGHSKMPRTQVFKQFSSHIEHLASWESDACQEFAGSRLFTGKAPIVVHIQVTLDFKISRFAGPFDPFLIKFILKRGIPLESVGQVGGHLIIIISTSPIPNFWRAIRRFATICILHHPYNIWGFLLRFSLLSRSPESLSAYCWSSMHLHNPGQMWGPGPCAPFSLRRLELSTTYCCSLPRRLDPETTGYSRPNCLQTSAVMRFSRLIVFLSARTFFLGTRSKFIERTLFKHWCLIALHTSCARVTLSLGNVEKRHAGRNKLLKNVFELHCIGHAEYIEWKCVESTAWLPNKKYIWILNISRVQQSMTPYIGLA